MFKLLDRFKRKQLKQAREKLEVKKAKEAVSRDEKIVTPKRVRREPRDMKSNAWKVLEEPITTEKTTLLGESGKYVFSVAPRASSTEVAKAIEEVYGVNVRLVNIINVKGKKVNFGRTSGKQKDWKKAIVTLEKGEKINIYEK